MIVSTDCIYIYLCFTREAELILCTAAAQTGHGPEADLWSLGILIYELVEVGRLVGQISCTSTNGNQWSFIRRKFVQLSCAMVMVVLHREDLLLSDPLHKRRTPIFCRFSSKVIKVKSRLGPYSKSLQGMDHAEFPDYVSDIAKNLIFALCR